MQQWLNLVPLVGALFNLAAAMTNLAATIINRRSTTSDRSATTSHARPLSAQRAKATSEPIRLRYCYRPDPGLQLSEVTAHYL